MRTGIFIKSCAEYILVIEGTSLTSVLVGTTSTQRYWVRDQSIFVVWTHSLHHIKESAKGIQKGCTTL